MQEPGRCFTKIAPWGLKPPDWQTIPFGEPTAGPTYAPPTVRRFTHPHSSGGMKPGNPTRTGEHSAFTCVRFRLKPNRKMMLAPSTPGKRQDRCARDAQWSAPKSSSALAVPLFAGFTTLAKRNSTPRANAENHRTTLQPIVYERRPPSQLPMSFPPKPEPTSSAQ